MKKAELVSKFLRHWDPLLTAAQAESEVLLCFNAEYPVSNYAGWNVDVDDEWSEHFFHLHRDDRDIDILWLVAGLRAVGKQPANPYPSARGGTPRDRS